MIVEHRKLTLSVMGMTAMIIASCLTLVASNYTFNHSDASVSFEDRPIFGMKVIKQDWFATEEQRQRLIDFCLEYDLQHLIVPVPVIAKPQQNDQWIVEHGAILTKFIAKAADFGISLGVLAQLPNDDLTPKQTAVLEQLRAVIAFNKTLPPRARFLDLHYDVNLQKSPKWLTNQRHHLAIGCLELFASLRTVIQQERAPLRLSATVIGDHEDPTANDDRSILEFNGQNKRFVEHLQDITDHVAISCHRHAYDTDRPISEQIEPELSYAQWADRSVYMTMQTTRLPQTPHHSYYGRPTWEFWLQKRKAQEALRGRHGFAGILVDCYESFDQILSQQPDEAKPAPMNRTFGMWVWHEKWVRDESQHDILLAFCENYGINLLPIQIHLAPGSVKRGRPTLRHEKQLRQLIEKARRKGIRIEALDGAPEMGLAQNRASALAILDVILAFNRTLPPDAALTGIHYDIELYLLPDWKTSKRQQIMREYLEFMEAAHIKIELDGLYLTLSASIPFWYDEKTADDDSCIMEYNGQRKNFHEHIQDLTDYVVIMSYRRNALGKDSISEHVEVERAYAEWTGRYICAGMETIEIKDDPEVSFHGVPPTEFWFQKEKLDHALHRRGGFGGIVVHSYESLAPYLSDTQGATPGQLHSVESTRPIPSSR